MKEMKTISFNGQQYEVVDAEARDTLTQYQNEIIDPPGRNILKLRDTTTPIILTDSTNENPTENKVYLSIKNDVINIYGFTDTQLTKNVVFDAFDLAPNNYTLSVKNLRSNFQSTGTAIYLKNPSYQFLRDDSTNERLTITAVPNLSWTIKTVSFSENKTAGVISFTVSPRTDNGTPRRTEIDQTFSLQLEAGTESTTYMLPNKKVFSENLSKTLEEITDNVVYASSFGAIGDGATDDYAALQAAIDYCSESYKLLKLDSGKNYLISQPLVWNKNSIYLDGNFAAITSWNYLSSLIILNSSDINASGELKSWSLKNRRQQVIKDLLLNCNGVVNTGIKIEQGVKTHCSNVTINNPIDYGVYIGQKGYENFISNVHVTRVINDTNMKIPGSDKGGVGIYVAGSDNSIDNVVTIGCEIGIVNIGGDNHYTKVHPWTTTEASANIKDSISFDCRYGYATFSQCMGDSTTTIFRFSGPARAMITSCANTWSEDFVKNAKQYSIPNSYLFYFVNEDVPSLDASGNQLYDENGEPIYLLKAHENKGQDITVSSCYFKTPNKELLFDNDFKCYYSNLSIDDIKILIDRITDNWENLPNTTENYIQQLATPLEIINVEYNPEYIDINAENTQPNQIAIKNGVVYGSLDFTTKTDISGQLFTTTTLPQPPMNFCVECTPFNTDEFVGTGAIIVSGLHLGLEGIGLKQNNRYIVSFSYPIAE